VTVHYDIVEACLLGDRNAQFKLYNLYARAMYNTCLRMVSDAETAQDVLQNAFCDVFQSLDSFRFESSVGTWIKRIVINNCLNHIKKRKLYFQELNETAHHIIDTDETDDISFSVYNVERVRKAIDILPEGYKVVLTLYAFEGYDHEEIASILGITESTSKSQYLRAKNKLKSLLI